MRSLQPHLHGAQVDYFRLLVLVITFAWGRRQGVSLYRYLDIRHRPTRFIETNWLAGIPLDQLHVVFSRKPSAITILGLVTDTPPPAVALLIQTYARRRTIELWVKGLEPRLGLRYSQPRPSWETVNHRHLVCYASALLSHLRLLHHSAQGHRTYPKAADLSTAAAQVQLRCLLWEELMATLREK